MAKGEKWPSSGPIEKDRQNVPGRPILMIAIGHQGPDSGDDNGAKGGKAKSKACPMCGGTGAC